MPFTVVKAEQPKQVIMTSAHSARTTGSFSLAGPGLNRAGELMVPHWIYHVSSSSSMTLPRHLRQSVQAFQLMAEQIHTAVASNITVNTIMVA